MLPGRYVTSARLLLNQEWGAEFEAAIIDLTQLLDIAVRKNPIQREQSVKLSGCYAE